MQPTIMVFSLSNDSHADTVERKLCEAHRGIRIIRINLDQWSARTRLSLDADHVEYRGSDGAMISFAPDTIWNRTIETRHIPIGNDEDGTVRTWTRREWGEAIEAIAWAHPRAMNTMTGLYLARNKLHQLTVARAHGLAVPETCITNNEERAIAFIAQVGHAVMKPLHGELVCNDQGEARVLYTNRVTEELIRSVPGFATSPIMLQQEIPKDIEVRATIVGDDVFACEIHSQDSPQTSVDWRRYDLPHTPHRVHVLPQVVVTRILDAMRTLHLVYGACDLIRTPDGEYIFLEVNATGQWLWIEALTNLPISDAVASWLAGAQTR